MFSVVRALREGANFYRKDLEEDEFVVRKSKNLNPENSGVFKYTKLCTVLVAFLRALSLTAF